MRVISGIAKGVRLESLKGHEYRPTSDKVKEALFNILSPYIEGAVFLDLYSGTGGIGIEALSRGAAFCVFVERSRAASMTIKRNLEKSSLVERGKVLPLPVTAALGQLDGQKFDFIFLDPPYEKDILSNILEEISISALKLLTSSGIIIVEASKREKFHLKENLEIYREERYGDTILYFIEKRRDTV